MTRGSAETKYLRVYSVQPALHFYLPVVVPHSAFIAAVPAAEFLSSILELCRVFVGPGL